MSLNIWETLDDLQARMFFMNKKSDRIASLLKHQFHCSRFSDLFHNDFAHFWIFSAADQIVSIKDACCISSSYPSVEGSEEDFSTIDEMFDFLYDLVSETKDLIQEAIVISENDHELFVKCSLEDFLLKFQKVVYSSSLLYKKSLQYGKDLSSFDRDANSWYVCILDIFGE